MRFFKILFLLLFISFKFIASPVNFGSNKHDQNNRKYLFKSALEHSKSQLFGTEFNESEETNEDTKDIDMVAKIGLSISLFFTFRALILRKTYLPSWIFSFKIQPCQQLFVLFLNFRI
jgi:hypothetical protein